MNRLTVGSSRRKNNANNGKEKNSRTAEIMTTAGIGAMAAVLISCMIPASDQSFFSVGSNESADPKNAVYVMSTAVEVQNASREELVMPDKKASAEGEESFFEIIGEFFASMIFGEG